MKINMPKRSKRNRYTTEELNARLRFSVGVMLAFTVFLSTLAIIYAVTFVTQPLGEVQSENDKAFFGLLSTTISFLVGVISGFMLNGTSAAGPTSKEEEDSK
jgi:cytochrome bd-type quinol oxidase subunit 1